jgi:endonuclease-8
MPEGDTIFRTAVSLRRWIGGREVTAARSSRHRVDATRLVGRTVDDVEAQGKHLLIRFSGGLVLHTHMQMTGSWHVYPTGERWNKAASQARVVVETGARLAVCFNAPIVELLTEADLRAHRGLRRLGPDVLKAAELDLVDVRARARARAAAAPTVGELLLDQQVVAGIGNVYRNEALFLCGANPWLATADLDDDLIDRLVSTASRLMLANAATSAFDRSFDGGPNQPWVYKRSGRPCRRCGTIIERDLLGPQARSVYWCRTCQPRGGWRPEGPGSPELDNRP